MSPIASGGHGTEPPAGPSAAALDAVLHQLAVAMSHDRAPPTNAAWSPAEPAGGEEHSAWTEQSTSREDPLRGMRQCSITGCNSQRGCAHLLRNAIVDAVELGVVDASLDLDSVVLLLGAFGHGAHALASISSGPEDLEADDRWREALAFVVRTLRPLAQDGSLPAGEASARH